MASDTGTINLITTIVYQYSPTDIDKNGCDGLFIKSVESIDLKEYLLNHQNIIRDYIRKEVRDILRSELRE